MRKTVLVLASVALAMLLLSGVALAANITCPTGANGLCRGTSQDDTLTGTDARDYMKGQAGNDTFYAKGGKNDMLEGGAGDDVLHGQLGMDIIHGDHPSSGTIRGDDVLLGKSNSDRLRGDVGTDILKGGPGSDEIFSHCADYWYEYQSKCPVDSQGDTLWGGDGDDRLMGGAGDDVLYGEGGRDSFKVGEGLDKAYGGPDTDSFSVLEGEGKGDFSEDLYVGQGGKDFYYAPMEGVTGTATFEAADGQADQIRCAESYTETVRADSVDLYIEGIDGRDATGHGLGRQYCDHLTIVK